MPVALHTRLVAALAVCAVVPLDGLRRKSRAKDERNSDTDAKSIAGASFGGQAQQMWDAYVQDVEGAYSRYGGTQKNCAPTMYPNKGAYKGTVVMFHGFTACPQQFEYMAPFLMDRGFVVLTPLLPGHGMELKRGGDQWNLMPTNESKYEQFGAQIHSIVQAAGGERVVFGLSLGGTMASYVGKMGGYDRRFIAVPLVAMSGIMDSVAGFVSQCNCVSNIPIGWGEACETERGLGRAGICKFNTHIVAAARAFGSGHLGDLGSRDKVSDGQMQVVFVQDDGAVSSKQVRALASKYGIDSNSKYMCGMDAAIGHSFLSPYDTPNQNKYWLKELTHFSVEFLASGTPLKQDGWQRIEGAPRCDVRCTAESCLYSSLAKR